MQRSVGRKPEVEQNEANRKRGNGGKGREITKKKDLEKENEGGGGTRYPTKKVRRGASRKRGAGVMGVPYKNSGPRKPNLARTEVSEYRKAS